MSPSVGPITERVVRATTGIRDMRRFHGSISVGLCMFNCQWPSAKFTGVCLGVLPASIIANRKATSTAIKPMGIANAPWKPTFSYIIPPSKGPSKHPQVSAIVVYPKASLTRSDGTLSAMTARPTTQTAAAERPCSARATIKTWREVATMNAPVEAPSANNPKMNGNRLDRHRSAKYPNNASSY